MYNTQYVNENMQHAMCRYANTDNHDPMNTYALLIAIRHLYNIFTTAEGQAIPSNRAF